MHRTRPQRGLLIQRHRTHIHINTLQITLSIQEIEQTTTIGHTASVCGMAGRVGENGWEKLQW